MLALICLSALRPPFLCRAEAPDDEAAAALLRELDALAEPRAAADTLRPRPGRAGELRGCLDPELAAARSIADPPGRRSAAS